MSGEEDVEGNPAEIPTAASIQTAVDEVATKTESIVYKNKRFGLVNTRIKIELPQRQSI